MATETLTGLTTLLTPPASCSSSWTYEMEFYNSVPGGLLMQNALPVDVDTSCFPPDFGYVGRVQDPVEVYNPGACPVGYTTAGESFNGDTTLAVCCQSGFAYTSSFSQKDQFNSTTVLFAGCTSTYPFSSGSTIVPARSGTELNSTIVAGPIIMWAQPISVEFRSADIALFTTSTTASATKSRTTSTAQPSNTATQPTASPTTSTIPTSSSNSGIPTATIAAISVAAVTLTAVFLAGIVYLLRRKRRKVETPPAPIEDDRGRWERQELDTSAYRGEIPRREIPRGEIPRGELDGTYVPPDEKALPRAPKRWAELE